MWREWRAGARLLLCARRRKSAPLLELHGQHSRPQAAVSRRGQRSSAENRLLRAGVFVQLTGPLHHSGRRKSPFPVPASSGLRSHAQISMTLSKWGGTAGKGREQGSSATSSPPPPRPQNSPVRTAPRVPGHVPSPYRSLQACRTHWPVSRGGVLRGWPEGGVGPPKSHQFSTRFSKRRGGGMRAGASAACHHGPCSSSQAPRGTKIRASRSPGAMTPRLRH